VDGEQVTAIYEQCRSDLGRLWHGRTDTYGRLALAATPADINATNDDDAFMTYAVRSMCDGFGWIGTTSQVRACYCYFAREIEQGLTSH